MALFSTHPTMTDDAVSTMLQMALAKANELNCPQCIVIVDASGVVLAQFRMVGAKFLSQKTAHAKACTAASIGAPSDQIPEPVRPAVAAASGGSVTGLPGGLPIIKDGVIMGGIGVGSGSPQQDISVARAALAAIGLDISNSKD